MLLLQKQTPATRFTLHEVMRGEDSNIEIIAE